MANEAIEPGRSFLVGLLLFTFAMNLIARGTQESFAVFLLPVQKGLGLTRPEITLTYAANMLTYGLAAPFAGQPRGFVSADGAKVEDGVDVTGPCFIDAEAVIKPGARIGPYSVIGRACHVEEGAHVEGAILWANNWIGRDAQVRDALLGRNCHVGRNVIIQPGAILGDKSVATDFTQV